MHKPLLMHVCVGEYYDDGSCTDVGCAFNFFACAFVVCIFDYDRMISDVQFRDALIVRHSTNPCATDDDGSCGRSR